MRFPFYLEVKMLLEYQGFEKSSLLPVEKTQFLY